MNKLIYGNRKIQAPNFKCANSIFRTFGIQCVVFSIQKIMEKKRHEKIKIYIKRKRGKNIAHSQDILLDARVHHQIPLQ